MSKDWNDRWGDMANEIRHGRRFGKSQMAEQAKRYSEWMQNLPKDLDLQTVTEPQYL